jgi:hypothetical protein
VPFLVIDIWRRGGYEMRIGALVLGILGGIAIIAGTIVSYVLGVIVISAVGLDVAEWVGGLVWAVIPLALVSIIGGALAIAKPTFAGIIMLISGILGSIAISVGYLFGGAFLPGYLLGAPLLIAGGVVALIARKTA